MLQKESSEVIGYYLAGSTFVFLLVVAIIIYIFLHHKKVTELRMKLILEEIKKKEDVLNAINEGEERERVRISEELHDGVNAKLSGLNMTLEYLLHCINGIENKALAEKVIIEINDIIDELREISQSLQPSFISNTPLNLLLFNYIDHLNDLKRCRYNAYIENEMADLDLVIKLNCYRIATELLLNTHKHSNATVASLQMYSTDNGVEIIVEDNGKGMDKNISCKGIGLLNIRNRVDLLNGHINLDSSKNGTTIIITLPSTIHL